MKLIPNRMTCTTQCPPLGLLGMGGQKCRSWFWNGGRLVPSHKIMMAEHHSLWLPRGGAEIVKLLARQEVAPTPHPWHLPSSHHRPHDDCNNYTFPGFSRTSSALTPGQKNNPLSASPTIAVPLPSERMRNQLSKSPRLICVPV